MKSAHPVPLPRSTNPPPLERTLTVITKLEFKSLSAQGYNRIPLIVEAFADLETPLSLYLKLTGNKEPASSTAKATTAPPRPYVRQAFRKYLECGIFAHGFARTRCGDCGHNYFVAFSCKGPGV